MLAKRLTLSILAVGVISLIVTAASFALFTASTTNVNNTFTSGTVTLGNPATTVLDALNIAPGDSGGGAYTVQYTGSLDAWLGLTTTLTGDLVTCDGGKFHVTISDGVNSYSASAADQVIGAVPFVPAQTANLAVAWNLDLSAGNACQAKTAQLTMMVKAVQSRNNTTGAGPTSW